MNDDSNHHTPGAEAAASAARLPSPAGGWKQYCCLAESGRVMQAGVW